MIVWSCFDIVFNSSLFILVAWVNKTSISSKFDKNSLGLHTGLVCFNSVSKKFLKSDRKKHKFGVEYYKRLNDEQINLDYRTYINYIKQQVDFYFHHQSSLDSNVPSVITELGEKQFYKYVIDDGDHFGIEGSKWQANWIKDQLNSKGILWKEKQSD